MTVSDGQPVNAAVSNAAWVSKTANDAKSGTLDLTNGSSGGTISNIQGAANTTMDATGVTGYADPQAKIYSSNNVVSNGDNRKVCIGKLDAKFDASTGHIHSGSPGDAPQLNINNSTIGTLSPLRGGTGLTSYTAGDLIYASATGTLAKFGIGSDGQVLTALSGTITWSAGSSGGGGGSINWFVDEAAAAEETVEFSEQIYKFAAGLAQVLRCNIKVPTNYQVGKQIKMKLGLYSPSTSNSFEMQTTAYLIRAGTDAYSSTTNSNVNAQVTTNTVANLFNSVTFTLTDASGQVNSVAVSGGDVLKVVLTRNADSDTADVRMVPGATEVTFIG